MHQSEIKVTPHFKFSEFNCKDGTPVPPHLFYNIRMLAGTLEAIRLHFRTPIIINSAYRTEVYNRRVGGASKSYHLSAQAVDFTIKGVTPKHIFQQLSLLMKKGLIPKGGLIEYKTFIHYDQRGFEYLKSL